MVISERAIYHWWTVFSWFQKLVQIAIIPCFPLSFTWFIPTLSAFSFTMGLIPFMIISLRWPAALSWVGKNMMQLNLSLLIYLLRNLLWSFALCWIWRLSLLGECNVPQTECGDEQLVYRAKYKILTWRLGWATEEGSIQPCMSNRSVWPLMLI